MAALKRGEPDPQAVQLSLLAAEGAAPAAGAIPMPTPSSSLRLANAWFGTYLASASYSANTIESYTTTVELLARYLGEEYRLDGVRKQQLQRFVGWLARGDGQTPMKTLALRVTGLRRFFRVLVDKKVLLPNPADDLYAPAGDVPLPDVLTTNEEERLRALAWDVYRREIRPDAQPLFVTMLTLDLGLRRGELETLSRSQVDVSRPQVTLRIRYRERRHRYKNRTLVAPPLFREVYRGYGRQYPPADERVIGASRRTLHRIVERLGTKVGAAVRVTPMVMRWTCALRWYNELPPEEVQRLLGLSPIGWQDADRTLRALQRRREGRQEAGRA